MIYDLVIKNKGIPTRYDGEQEEDGNSVQIKNFCG